MTAPDTLRPTLPATVWIVTGESASVPGRPMTAHASAAAADDRAAELMNALLEGAGKRATATPDSWRTCENRLYRATGGRSFVHVYPLPVRA